MKKLSVSILSLLLLQTFPVHSQFRKYKARTQFKSDQTSPDKQEPVPPASDEKDFFGRGTGVKGVQRARAGKKYVNLNPETAFGPEVVTDFNFSDTPLVELTRHMQKLTGINLMWDKEIKGKVTILAPSAITVGEAWKAYLTALNLNGYTLVKSGAFYKIINARDARTTPTKIYTGAFTPTVENFLMKVIPIKNIKSEEIYQNLRRFASKYGRIINIRETNTIIILDTGTNINRLSKLIKFLDVPGHEETLHIIHMKHSSAQEIARLLDSIFKRGEQTVSLEGIKIKKKRIPTFQKSSPNLALTPLSPWPTHRVSNSSNPSLKNSMLNTEPKVLIKFMFTT